LYCFITFVQICLGLITCASAGLKSRHSFESFAGLLQSLRCCALYSSMMSHNIVVVQRFVCDEEGLWRMANW
jgi:hypothetical protein